MSSNNPKNGNGLAQLIRVGYSIPLNPLPHRNAFIAFSYRVDPDLATVRAA